MSNHHTHSILRTRAARGVAASAAAIVGLTGVAGCGDSEGPERGEVTAEDLQEIDEELGALEDRVGELEGDAGAAGEPEADVFTDGDSLVGEEVTVSAGVSDLVAPVKGGAAFWIAEESGEPIAVIAATPPAELDANDLVKVSGKVTLVKRDSFENDFGIAEDEAFDDPDAFFDEAEGQVAIAADRIEVLQEQD